MFPFLNSHEHVDLVFFFGRQYLLMPRILLHAISRAMAEVCRTWRGDAAKALEALKKNLNETRKSSKATDQVTSRNPRIFTEKHFAFSICEGDGFGENRCFTGNSFLFFQKVFRGRLSEPFYRMIWRDTHGGAHMIQEEAPFTGTHQEKQEYVARWHNIVEDKLADKHPNVSFPGETPRKTLL